MQYARPAMMPAVNREAEEDRDISLRRRIWSLSGHSGLRQAVRPADLWGHGLASVYKLTRLIAASYDSRN